MFANLITIAVSVPPPALSKSRLRWHSFWFWGPACSCNWATMALSSGTRFHLLCELLALCFCYDIDFYCFCFFFYLFHYSFLPRPSVLVCTSPHCVCWGPQLQVKGHKSKSYCEIQCEQILLSARSCSLRQLIVFLSDCMQPDGTHVQPEEKEALGSPHWSFPVLDRSL